MKKIKLDFNHKVEIIAYTDQYKDDLKRLNFEWLEKHFKVEESDRTSLTNPKQEIINRGGFVYFAKLKGEIVGTVALLKKTDKVFELAKMAVSPKAQGYGIGSKLLEYAIDVAKEKGFDKLILYSNTQLAPALHLYKKYGFVEVELEKGLYERADIKMELIIN